MDKTRETIIKKVEEMEIAGQTKNYKKVIALSKQVNKLWLKTFRFPKSKEMKGGGRKKKK